MYSKCWVCISITQWMLSEILETCDLVPSFDKSPHNDYLFLSACLFKDTCLCMSGCNIQTYQLLFLLVRMAGGWLVLIDKCVSVCLCTMSQATLGRNLPKSNMIITLMICNLDAPKPQGHNNLTWGRKYCPGWRPEGQLTRSTACLCAPGFTLLCSIITLCWPPAPEDQPYCPSPNTAACFEWALPPLWPWLPNYAWG